MKKEKRINTLKKKIAKLEQLQKQLEQIEDKEKRINLTDPDAPVMRFKDGRSRLSYNHQTARDDKYRVVTAVETQRGVYQVINRMIFYSLLINLSGTAVDIMTKYLPIVVLAVITILKK